MVALWLAISHPDRVRRAVFADTAARIGTTEMWNERIAAVQADGMRAIRGTILARFLSESFRSAHPTVTDTLGATLEATNPDGYIAACEALRDTDLTESVASIRLPSLIVVGALDIATPPAQAEELHRLIAASELTVLPGAGHLANVDASAAFTERVLTFLQ
jgi:pimeloyl-ACP methyl ester carboxylesterase